jgi:hypothetical protein
MESTSNEGPDREIRAAYAYDDDTIRYGSTRRTHALKLHDLVNEVTALLPRARRYVPESPAITRYT